MSFTTLPNTYPVGAVVECAFYFTNRALTAEEYQTFASGGGLPVGVGVDPASVLFHYRINGGSALTASATKDATGLYHATISVTEAGDYRYQGYGQDGGGNAFAAMAPRNFEAVAF